MTILISMRPPPVLTVSSGAQNAVATHVQSSTVRRGEIVVVVVDVVGVVTGTGAAEGGRCPVNYL